MPILTIWIEILKNSNTIGIINMTIHMSKKEGNIENPTNVVGSPFFGLMEDTETVPYLNNDSDMVQDILTEVEKNTKGLQMGLMAKNSVSVGNIIDIDFS
jgi:hypothetical protein